MLGTVRYDIVQKHIVYRTKIFIIKKLILISYQKFWHIKNIYRRQFWYILCYTENSIYCCILYIPIFLFTNIFSEWYLNIEISSYTEISIFLVYRYIQNNFFLVFQYIPKIPRIFNFVQKYSIYCKFWKFYIYQCNKYTIPKFPIFILPWCIYIWQAITQSIFVLARITYLIQTYAYIFWISNPHNISKWNFPNTPTLSKKKGKKRHLSSENNLMTPNISFTTISLIHSIIHECVWNVPCMSCQVMWFTL